MDMERNNEGQENNAEEQQVVENQNDPGYCRVKLSNLPPFIRYQQAKKLVIRLLAGMPYRKLKLAPTVAYFTVPSSEEAIKAVELMHNTQFKGKRLIAKRVPAENEVRPLPEEVEIFRSKTANEITAPLWNMPYEEQLELKFRESQDMLYSLLADLSPKASTSILRSNVRMKLMPIMRSPVLTNYRNKCEFTIGLDHASQPCVGFVSGIMSKKVCVVVSVEDSVLITENTRKICAAFTEIVKESGMPVFDEFQRTGFWKRLVVRDFSGDCMIIVVVHPYAPESKIKLVQYEILKRFLPSSDAENEYEFSVRSVYWHIQHNSSDTSNCKHIGGVPYIYETLLGVRYRVSNETFFQTNSRCAEVLYTVIGDVLRLPSATRPLVSLKPAIRPSYQKPLPFIVLDICCGAGTIGQSQLRRVQRAIQAERFDGTCFCIGVELNNEAVDDARQNAEDNGFYAKDCHYISGDADLIFKGLDKYYDANDITDLTEFVGVLDPPRAGVSSRVISSCRETKQMRRLVYVSCDPSLAQKNIVDLCRPSSNRYTDDPFEVEKVYPIDMFPQTTHQEWVILLTR